MRAWETTGLGVAFATVLATGVLETIGLAVGVAAIAEVATTGAGTCGTLVAAVTVLPDVAANVDVNECATATGALLTTAAAGFATSAGF